jgi:putative nucleotidyltransferase with HDIG domain
MRPNSFMVLYKEVGEVDRATAWQLVTEYTASESLQRHMLAVECAMRAYAAQYQGDPEIWGVTGLLHDFDYERYPDVAVDGHPVVGSRILEEKGVAEEIRRAILSHAPEITGIHPETPMEKVLYAVDELTGFIIAVALVRPSKSLMDLTYKSIKKKWKDRAFAAGVDRDHIEEAVANLGVDLEQHVNFVLGAMQQNAATLSME